MLVLEDAPPYLSSRCYLLMEWGWDNGANGASGAGRVNGLREMGLKVLTWTE